MRKANEISAQKWITKKATERTREHGANHGMCANFFLNRIKNVNWIIWLNEVSSATHFVSSTLVRSLKRNENENEPFERQKKRSRHRELNYEWLAGGKENKQTNESIDKGGVSGYLISIQAESQWASGKKREWPSKMCSYRIASTVDRIRLRVHTSCHRTVRMNV